MNKKYFEYKKLNLCRRCGDKPLEGKTRCERCHIKHLEYQKKSKANAEKQGLCRNCLIKEIQIGSSMCVECLESHRIYGRKKYQKYRQLCIENYGGKCTCCGCKVAKYLQLDHINNDGSEHRKKIYDGGPGIRGGSIYPWACRNNYPSNLQLLCANCHQAKTTCGGCTEEDHRIMRLIYEVSPHTTS